MFRTCQQGHGSDRTTGTGQPAQDSWGRIIKTRQLGHVSQRGQDAQLMTARHPRQDSWDRTDGQDNQNMTAWTRQREQETWGKRALR
jgi:hypothetical protein